MGEREAIALIFLPGFSTAEKITNVSGRGVGMDVVRTNVEKIGGTVDVTSRVGHGSTLRIKIPLTLAIIPALVVTSGGERFAIPQVSLLELVRVEEGGPGIEMINGTPLYRLRGNLLPLAYLNGELGIVTPPRTAAQQADGETVSNATNIVVLRSGDRSFGLVVDQINDTEEIVVKPLGKQL
jgi:two-component system chemotaxis sensor kinase CheA